MCVISKHYLPVSQFEGKTLKNKNKSKKLRTTTTASKNKKAIYFFF